MGASASGPDRAAVQRRNEGHRSPTRRCAAGRAGEDCGQPRCAIALSVLKELGISVEVAR